MPGDGELKAYSRQKVEEGLKALPEWKYREGCLIREYYTKNWKETVLLFNAIAALAEAHWHHPDIEAGFKKLKIKLTTHEVGGITDKDFNLATEIEKLATQLLKR
ncbi:MAG: 4a-hydroxytetrahydrobiopterin dehydratase [Aquificaceae bacterium]